MNLLRDMIRETELFLYSTKTPAAMTAELALTQKLNDLFAAAIEETVWQVARGNYLLGPQAAFQQIAPSVAGAIQDVVGELQIHGTPMTAAEILRSRSFAASDRTMARVIGDVNGILADAVEAGLSSTEMATQLQTVFTDMSSEYMRSIANTEIHHAIQESRYEQMKNDSDVNYHQWWTVSDDRVRSTHAEQHGEIVRVGDPFSNGLLFPGDTSTGAPEEFMNCRCVLLAFDMPFNMMPPLGMLQFFERDLVSIEGGN